MSTAQNPSPDTRDRSASEQVREALAAHADSTATELAEATGLGKSTVGKVLATRRQGTGHAGSRGPGPPPHASRRGR